MPTTRADVVARRTYMRPKNEQETEFETWEDVIDRVIDHQRWLWLNALGKDKLPANSEKELAELRKLMINRRSLPGGRILWMGGTAKAKERQISQFNCSGLIIETVHDVVDAFWLLLNGAGVGFKPVSGCLNGFMKYIPEIEVIRSTRADSEGFNDNVERFKDGVWTIKVGDSGEAWAKAVGKLLAGKYPAQKLVIDFSEVRPGGSRLKGYGWISSGDAVISEEIIKIANILNRRAGHLLSKMDILDIVNHLGVIQTGRRGAEIALMDYGDSEWREFASAKYEYWKSGNHQRSQSNNSLIFWEQPSLQELDEIFEMMIDSGGSEPGLINGKAAKQRAPWFSTLNPCSEILLSNKGLCNLVETNLAAFDSSEELHRAIGLISRANYRQTLVNLDDGVLQRSWHENNQFLRLCGVSLTGWTSRPDLSSYDIKVIKNIATQSAYNMADELGLQRPKNVTTVKPSGTLSKIMDTKEGCHEALSKYLFNHITFSKHDKILDRLEDSGYYMFDHPTSSDGIVVRFPVKWDTGNFTEVEGKHVNLESATDQLNRYKTIMDNYCEQNCSITVSYDKDEAPEIVDWMDKNWDSYVGVSFLFRTDPTKTAEDLGYPFLPQEPVTKEQHDKYLAKLKPVNLDASYGAVDDLTDEECLGGVCPVR